MVQELFNQNIFMYVMLGVCACGVLSKLILNIVYSRLVNASNSMATSKNKLTRLMKMKFETCYKLKIGVNNVDIFVDKYVFHHKFCGILLSTWENIGGQILMLCLLIGSISTVLGLIYECGKTQILSTFSVGIVTSGLLIFLEGMTNLTGKKELMRLNMKDYLENLLKVRLEQENEHPELIEQYKKDYLVQEEEKESLQSPALVAATTFDVVTETGKKKDKPSTSKFQKRMLKRQKKDAARHEKENKVATKKAEKEKKLEDKRLAIENRKKEIEEKKKEAREAKEAMKRETKLALDKKREAERAEIERIRAEVKAEELRKKEEKRRQDEIKKALLIEKQVAKENKKKQQVDYKTIAQEKKENLLKEVQERRNYDPIDDEKEMEPINVLKEQVAVTLMDETLEELEANKKETMAQAYNVEKVKIEYVKPQQVKPEPFKVETIQVQGKNVMSQNKMGINNAEKVKSINNLAEAVKPATVNHVEASQVEVNQVEVNHLQKKNNQLNQVNKKEKKNNLTEDKLIEDILKEFLA